MSARRTVLLVAASVAAVAVIVLGAVTAFLVTADLPEDVAPSAAPVGGTASPSAPSSSTDTTASVADLVDAAWVAEAAERTGIPPRALAAYAGAAAEIARTDPACGLGWNTLAAIGLVESEHGTIDGSRLGADGVARPAIVGIALDGRSSARISDTDRGALDGDAVWDRAVGPMQFIPTTWDAYGRDGNGDGLIDVQQIDDAALTAGVYLCDVGGDLTVAANWIAAVHRYNPDTAYNHRVADAAAGYAAVG